MRRELRAHAGGSAAGLVARAARGLPDERTAWGTAMCAELARVTGQRARWAFALGCARTALTLRMRAGLMDRNRGGSAVRAVVLAGAGAALGLSLYGLERYPALRSGAGAWLSAAAAAAILLGYAGAALSLTRGDTAPAVAARRFGIAGGAAIGAAWLAIDIPGTFPKALVALPLAAALLVPAGVALVVGRSTGDSKAAADAALWSGLAGALLAFVVWVAATYASDGRPYDAQLLRDFHHSGGHDLAAYAVSDNLGAALGLLVIVPVVALALGSLTGRLAAARA
jgi:hypothetical protein